MITHRTMLCVLIACLAACTYDPAYEVSCDDEGARDGNRVCENGIWLVADAGDALDGSNNTADGQDGPDMDDPDGTMPDADMACVPEANVDFCARLGFDCGEVTAPDNCGAERTITCGMCEAPQSCGAVDANVCGCVPETATEFCTRLVKTCDMVTDLDNCGVERTQDCGTCTAPAECGGGGTPNVCACPDQTDVDFCMQAGAVCGAYTGTDECGVERTTSCGMCTSPETCGPVAANQCDCPDDAAVCLALQLECGMSDVSAQCGNKASVDCGGCQSNASCMANACVCDSGYVPDGLGNCEDVDECTTNSDNCDVNATCMNSAGGFDCTCNAGFAGDGTTCTDIDECMIGTDNCDVNAACTNNTGGFDCMCNSGFTGNGVTCTDDDECADMTDNCDANAMCTNTPGSFDCTCNAGYMGSGQQCTDIDECASAGANNCDANAMCTNTPGGFDCTCNDGYVGDGVTCDPRLVVSVQSGFAIMGNGTTSATISLGARIDSANAVPFVSVRMNEGELRDSTVDVVVNDDGVDVSRPAGGSTMVVAVTVVEFDPTRVSVQTASYSGEGNNSINAVDRSASFMTFASAIDHNNDNVDERMVSGAFNGNGDGLQIGRASTAGSLSGHFWVAESLDGGFSVQHLTGGFSNTSTTLAIPTAVAMAETFILYSYRTTETGTDLDDGAVSCELTDATTVTCTRDGGDQEITDLHVQVIEVPGATVQRGSTSFSGSGDGVSETIASVDAATALPNLGQTGSNGACQSDETSNNGFPTAAFTLAVTDATTLEVRRGAAGDGDAMCTWEVVQWP